MQVLLLRINTKLMRPTDCCAPSTWHFPQLQLLTHPTSLHWPPNRLHKPAQHSCTCAVLSPQHLCAAEAGPRLAARCSAQLQQLPVLLTAPP